MHKYNLSECRAMRRCLRITYTIHLYFVYTSSLVYRGATTAQEILYNFWADEQIKESCTDLYKMNGYKTKAIPQPLLLTTLVRLQLNREL